MENYKDLPTEAVDFHMPTTARESVNSEELVSPDPDPLSPVTEGSSAPGPLPTFEFPDDSLPDSDKVSEIPLEAEDLSPYINFLKGGPNPNLVKKEPEEPGKIKKGLKSVGEIFRGKSLDRKVYNPMSAD